MHTTFRPKPDPVLPGNGLLHLLPPDAGRQGIVAYAGRLLPLPTGTRRELAVARENGPELEQVILLDRVEGGHLTGLIMAAAAGALSGAAGPVDLPAVCNVPSRLDGQIVPVLPGARAH